MVLAQNGHHADCDAAEEPYHNLMCSQLCPLQQNLGGLAPEEWTDEYNGVMPDDWHEQ